MYVLDDAAQTTFVVYWRKLLKCSSNHFGSQNVSPSVAHEHERSYNGENGYNYSDNYHVTHNGEYGTQNSTYYDSNNRNSKNHNHISNGNVKHSQMQMGRRTITRGGASSSSAGVAGANDNLNSARFSVVIANGGNINSNSSTGDDEPVEDEYNPNSYSSMNSYPYSHAHSSAPCVGTHDHDQYNHGDESSSHEYSNNSNNCAPHDQYNNDRQDQYINPNASQYNPNVQYNGDCEYNVANSGSQYNSSCNSNGNSNSNSNPNQYVQSQYNYNGHENYNGDDNNEDARYNDYNGYNECNGYDNHYDNDNGNGQVAHAGQGFQDPDVAHGDGGNFDGYGAEYDRRGMNDNSNSNVNSNVNSNGNSHYDYDYSNDNGEFNNYNNSGDDTNYIYQERMQPNEQSGTWPAPGINTNQKQRGYNYNDRNSYDTNYRDNPNNSNIRGDNTSSTTSGRSTRSRCGKNKIAGNRSPYNYEGDMTDNEKISTRNPKFGNSRALDRDSWKKKEQSPSNVKSNRNATRNGKNRNSFNNRNNSNSNECEKNNEVSTAAAQKTPPPSIWVRQQAPNDCVTSLMLYTSSPNVNRSNGDFKGVIHDDELNPQEIKSKVKKNRIDDDKQVLNYHELFFAIVKRSHAVSTVETEQQDRKDIKDSKERKQNDNKCRIVVCSEYQKREAWYFQTVFGLTEMRNTSACTMPNRYNESRFNKMQLKHQGNWKDDDPYKLKMPTSHRFFIENESKLLIFDPFYGYNVFDLKNNRLIGDKYDENFAPMWDGAFLLIDDTLLIICKNKIVYFFSLQGDGLVHPQLIEKYYIQSEIPNEVEGYIRASICLVSSQCKRAPTDPNEFEYIISFIVFGGKRNVPFFASIIEFDICWSPTHNQIVDIQDKPYGCVKFCESNELDRSSSWRIHEWFDSSCHQITLDSTLTDNWGSYRENYDAPTPTRDERRVIVIVGGNAQVRRECEMMDSDMSMGGPRGYMQISAEDVASSIFYFDFENGRIVLDRNMDNVKC